MVTTGDPEDGTGDPRRELSFPVNGGARPWKRIERAERVSPPEQQRPPVLRVELPSAQGKLGGAVRADGVSVPRTAAGLLGQEPLVNGTM